MKKKLIFNKKNQGVYLKIIAAVIIIIGCIGSGFKIFTPYSYWLDELWSINASSQPWGELHQLLLNDVHPPLYQAVLKLWISFFGATEPSTRFMSWLFAIASLAVVLRFASKKGELFFYIVAVCFSANMLFIYYANEARSYAMALFLSTLLITLYPFKNARNVSIGFLLTAIALSLTHYFGLFLTGLSLIVLALSNLKSYKSLSKIVLTGIICLIWPIHHLINGSIVSKAGGNFWIKVASPLDTITIASYTMLAYMGKVGGILFLVCLIIGAVVSYRNRKISDKPLAEQAEIGFVSSLLALSLVLTLAVVDIVTPMSTTRNFIVIVPIVIFAAAATLQLLTVQAGKLRIVILFLVTLYACSALFISYKRVLDKADTQQDWKSAIGIASREIKLRNLNIYSFGGSTDHYFIENGIPTSKMVRYQPGQTIIKPPAVIVYGHLGAKRYEEFKNAMFLLNARQLFPENDNVNSRHAGVFIID
jgi:uncharacterized membrane protein